MISIVNRIQFIFLKTLTVYDQFKEDAMNWTWYIEKCPKLLSSIHL